MYSFSQRVYQRWHAAYSCWQKKEALLCMWPTGYGVAQTRCFQSQQREKKTRPLSYPFLHSLSLNCTCLMSWHLFFRSLPPPHPPPPPLSLHAHTCFFLLLFLFFLSNVFSCWHSRCSGGDEGKRPRFAIKKLSVFCHSVSHSQSHIPCQGYEICGGGGITLLQK